jgi:uncharacterized protein YhhL (DUF1145 family)
MIKHGWGFLLLEISNPAFPDMLNCLVRIAGAITIAIEDLINTF